MIAALCIEFDALAFTDDIYEHIVFEGEHIPLATLPGMAERTVSIHSMSKTYSVTGWRIGWTIAPPDLSVGIRRVHDFLTVGAAAPLQAAAVVALDFPDAYYRDLVDGYRARRDLLLPALRAAGFRVHEPAGAYYVMTDIADLAMDGEDDVAFALRLIADPGVAAVPGSSFFSRPELGRTQAALRVPEAARDAVGRRRPAGEVDRSGLTARIHPSGLSRSAGPVFGGPDTEGEDDGERDTTFLIDRVGAPDQQRQRPRAPTGRSRV